MKYPKNIHDFWPSGNHDEFSIWAFGCVQPGSNENVFKCWESLHPEYPLKDSDSIFIAICKMSYLFHLHKIKESES